MTAAGRIALVASTLLCMAATALSDVRPQSTREPIVAAAADLQFALPEVAEAFKARFGQTVKLTFGSSGNFARQIRQHAPFDVFFSASEEFVSVLTNDGLTRDKGEIYAIGRIAIFVSKGSPLKADGTLADLKAALADGRLKRFAIANPQHAPYGARAEEALRHAGLWDLIKDKLVLGENASQAAQFAASSNAEGGIIAYSLAVSPKVAALGNFELISAEWHTPLRQVMVVTKAGSAVALSFYEFAKTAEARAIFKRYGFLLPGDGS